MNHTFETFSQIIADPLALGHLGKFLVAHAPEEIKTLFFFVLDADRCLRHEGTKKEADDLHNIIKTYLIPGGDQYIDPQGPLFPLKIEAKKKNGAIAALHQAALKTLDNEFFNSFLQSEEYEQLSLKNADKEGAGGQDPVTDRLLATPPAAAQPREPEPLRTVSFGLVKINDRGRAQNRTLALSTQGVDSLRGDTARFHYDNNEVHGLLLDKEDCCKFKLACLHYYEWECESEQQRYTVASAFQDFNLGTVEPPPSPPAQLEQGGPVATMEDFECHKVIGRGGLGKVLKVKHKITNRVYAMKQLKVPTLIKHKQVERARMEKEILMALNHPFLVRLHYSFLDNNQLCMVLDFASGGDLFFHLRKARGGRLHHMPAGFYVAEMVCALEYLHNHDIIHRDLKPENILMGADGHLLLTDFGLSKADVSSNDGEEGTPALSMVGTKEYVAPEVVQRKPYGKAVDWWAVGILFYELLLGHTPFDSKPGHIFDHIVKEPIRFQEGISVPAEAKELIMGLLNRNPEQRLSAPGIKSHAFFTGVMKMDFDALEEKEISAPIKPQLPGGDDSNNFPDRFVKERLHSFVAPEPRLEGAVASSFNYSTTL